MTRDQRERLSHLIGYIEGLMHAVTDDEVGVALNCVCEMLEVLLKEDEEHD